MLKILVRDDAGALELTKMVKSQVRTNHQVVFQRGDDLFWKAVNNTESWKQRKVLAEGGKLLLVRTCEEEIKSE